MNVDVRDAKTPREGYRKNIAKKKEKNGRRMARGERRKGGRDIGVGRTKARRERIAPDVRKRRGRGRKGRVKRRRRRRNWMGELAVERERKKRGGDENKKIEEETSEEER